MSCPPRLGFFLLHHNSRQFIMTLETDFQEVPKRSRRFIIRDPVKTKYT